MSQDIENTRTRGIVARVFVIPEAADRSVSIRPDDRRTMLSRIRGRLRLADVERLGGDGIRTDAVTRTAGSSRDTNTRWERDSPRSLCMDSSRRPK